MAFSGNVPVFFETAAQQRLLVCLAHYGPMRLTSALKTARVAEVDGGIKNLISRGVVRRWKPHPVQVYLALDSGFAVADTLRELLWSPPKLPLQGDGECVLSFPQGADDRQPSRHSVLNMFGSKIRTKTLLAIKAFGGHVDSVRLQRFFGTEHSIVQRVMMSKLEKRGVLSSGCRGVRNVKVVAWNMSAAGIDEFRILLRAILLLEPAVQLRADEILAAMRADLARPKTRLIDWRRPVARVDLPGPWRPPIDGAPLLFGSDTRRRILVALLKGPLRLIDLGRVARMRDMRTLSHLEAIGVVIQLRSKRQHVVAFHPELPAQRELYDLLTRLEESYPLKIGAQPRHQIAMLDLDRRAWKGDLTQLFGPRSRSAVLVTVGALGEADVSSLARLLPEFDRSSLRRSLYMFRNLGVLRSCREGNAISYRLNDEFPAHAELQTLLEVVYRLDPALLARAQLEEVLMTPNRLKMRANHRQRRQKAQKG